MIVGILNNNSCYIGRCCESYMTFFRVCFSKTRDYDRLLLKLTPILHQITPDILQQKSVSPWGYIWYLYCQISATLQFWFLIFFRFEVCSLDTFFERIEAHIQSEKAYFEPLGWQVVDLQKRGIWKQHQGKSKKRINKQVPNHSPIAVFTCSVTFPSPSPSSSSKNIKWMNFYRQRKLQKNNCLNQLRSDDTNCSSVQFSWLYKN